MKLVSRKPLIVEVSYYPDEETTYRISYVLLPNWDDSLIKIIEDNDLKANDIIDPYLIKDGTRKD